MEYIIKFFKGKKETVYGLAGLADLYVSAVGGRNSKMGEYLGKGLTFRNAKKRFMNDDTVEGADLAYEIAPYIFKKINNQKIPLMIALLNSIVKNKKLMAVKNQTNKKTKLFPLKFHNLIPSYL